MALQAPAGRAGSPVSAWRADRARAPARTCRWVILSEVGERRARSLHDALRPGCRRARARPAGGRRCPPPCPPQKQRAMAARSASSSPGPGSSCRSSSTGSTGSASASAGADLAEARGRDAVRHQPQPVGVGPADGAPGQRQVHADLVRHARERPAHAVVGKEADAGLGHGEAVALAGDAMRAVEGDADAASPSPCRRSARRSAW